ncbi:MAG: rRNA maturation RNase YbeY [Psychroflexus sp.]|jgi:rRNA maturation RNase YbeY|nr:rRNA maturation RNase YbeY [Psychroflexus sp.]MDR9447909.1 rRNA maturation RNase YbeY [Psychroflexus sp.]
MSNIVFQGNSKTNKNSLLKAWIKDVIHSNGYEADEITFKFVTDETLLSVNRTYLGHDDYTDIITFDYTSNKIISADIIISVERVEENADEFQVDYLDELARICIHGILHCMGLKDKSAKEKEEMRNKENEYLKLFHVEHDKK